MSQMITLVIPPDGSVSEVRKLGKGCVKEEPLVNDILGKDNTMQLTLSGSIHDTEVYTLIPFCW